MKNKADILVFLDDYECTFRFDLKKQGFSEKKIKKIKSSAKEVFKFIENYFKDAVFESKLGNFIYLKEYKEFFKIKKIKVFD